MEKTTRDRLVEAALQVLGRDGGSRFSVRLTEHEAGLPHGSVRHHFGGLGGLVDAMVEHLLRAEMERALTDPAETVRDWLGPHRVRTQARYELMTQAFRTPHLRDALVAARERVITDVAAVVGLPMDRAALLVISIDGLVLDALLRGESDLRTGTLELLMALNAATRADSPMTPPPTGDGGVVDVSTRVVGDHAGEVAGGGRRSRHPDPRAVPGESTGDEGPVGTVPR